MTVLIVGDAPSKLNTDLTIAFEGARCYPRLFSWLKDLDILKYYCVNSHTEKNLAGIYNHYIKQRGPILALGRNAQNRLKKLGIPFVALPHPSGRNRQLNDKERIKMLLSEAKEKLAQY